MVLDSSCPEARNLGNVGNSCSSEKRCKLFEFWWTRTQRIRTEAELPFETILSGTKAAPLYQRIAAKALHLHQLGLGSTTIARRLSTTRKTVIKGVATLRVRDVPVTDAHDLYNNLTKGQGYAPWGFRPSLPYQRRYRSTSSGVGLLTLRRWLT